MGKTDAVGISVDIGNPKLDQLSLEAGCKQRPVGACLALALNIAHRNNTGPLWNREAYQIAEKEVSRQPWWRRQSRSTLSSGLAFTFG